MTAERLTNALQHRLEVLYDLDLPARVADHVFSDAELAQRLRGAGQRPAREQLLLQQGGDELSLSLYLDRQLLQPLIERNPLRAFELDLLDAFAAVIEGVSHFVCVVWHALHHRPCTQLELELQAEVDKFALLHQLWREQRADSPQPLLACLFENIRFEHGLDAAESERYRLASHYAERYCGAMQQRYQGRLDHPQARTQLRRFYRSPQTEKVRCALSA